MGTMSQIPSSNPAGNNQMSPPGTGLKSGATPQIPMASQAQGSTPSQTNPYMPVNTSSTPTTPTATGGVPNAMGADGTSTNPNAANQDKQLVDIYGKGVGGDLNNLLNNISGVDSATLQQFEQSLIPQEATAQSNLNASLGAGGVSANSSVAALGDANLQSQEFAAISGEKANLLQSQEQLQAQLLTGMQQDASQEVAQSGWSVFGQVMSSIGQDAGGIMKGIASFNQPSSGSGSSEGGGGYADSGEF